MSSTQDEAPVEELVALDDALVPNGLFERLRAMLSKRSELRKLVRYTSTSVFALVVSEVALLILYSDTKLGATSAAFLANLVGTVPSYLLSRYWIWPDSDRHRPARQMVLYWVTSVITWVISSYGVGVASRHGPTGHLAHLAVLGCAYLVISLVLWVAKYVAYQTVIFPSSNRSTAESV